MVGWITVHIWRSTHEGSVMDKGNHYQTFDSSYWRIWLRTIDGVPFAEACISELIGASKEIESKFTAAGRDRMTRALLVAIIQLAASSQSEQPTEMLREVAIRHDRQNRDIPPHLYDIFLQCLLRVVQKYDPRYSNEVGEAWTQILTPGLEYMKSKYDA